jgi:hypothetical protein
MVIIRVLALIATGVPGVIVLFTAPQVMVYEPQHPNARFAVEPLPTGKTEPVHEAATDDQVKFVAAGGADTTVTETVFGELRHCDVLDKEKVGA